MALGLVSYVQLQSTELALKAIEKQQTPQADAVTDDAAPTATITQQDAAEPHVAPALTLVPETMGQDADHGDMTGPAFMRELKTWLAELSGDPASVAQGHAMSQALSSGTLTIHDPVEGGAVIAWDASGIRPQTVARREIAAIGWSQFLKQRVKREDGAGYVKDSDGNYIDMVSGECAYFGAVGSNFYYLTWPKHIDM